MQNLLFVFFLLFAHSPVVEDITVQESLNVFAPSGLNMRTTPSLKAKKLVKIPYGASVDVLENTKEHPLKVQEFKGFWIRGHWVKVRYKEHTGYVFDGYLSDLPAPKRQQYHPNKSAKMPDAEYFEHKLGKTGERYAIDYYGFADEENSESICAWSQDYKHDVTYSETSCSERSLEANIELKNTKLSEAYLLVYLWFYNKEFHTWSYDKEGKKPVMELQEAGCYYFGIYMKDKTTAVIEYTCGC